MISTVAISCLLSDGDDRSILDLQLHPASVYLKFTSKQKPTSIPKRLMKNNKPNRKFLEAFMLTGHQVPVMNF